MPDFPDPIPRPTSYCHLPDDAIRTEVMATMQASFERMTGSRINGSWPVETRERILKQFGSGITLEATAQYFESVFQRARFPGYGFYRFRDGFVIVARVEQTDEFGRSLAAADRWSSHVPPLRKFSLVSYVKRIATSNPGYYRLIAFVVTSGPIVFDSSSVDERSMRSLTAAGSTGLDAAAATVTATEMKHYALVYEFRRPNASSPVAFCNEPMVDASEHLRLAGIAFGPRPL